MINSSVPFLQNYPNSIISSFWFKFLQSLVPGNKVIQIPVTGFNIAVAAGVGMLILDPAGTLSSGTVILPPNAADGATFTFNSSQNITALTVLPNNGQTVKNAPTSFTTSTTSSQGYVFVYNQQNSTWYRTL